MNSINMTPDGSHMFRDLALRLTRVSTVGEAHIAMNPIVNGDWDTGRNNNL